MRAIKAGPCLAGASERLELGSPPPHPLFLQTECNLVIVAETGGANLQFKEFMLLGSFADFTILEAACLVPP